MPVQSEIIYGTPVDYKGETYQTVKIGEQTWFQRNLNYNAEGSRCYGDNSGDDSKGNCAIYGRLYNWATAMALPSECNSNACSSQVSSKHQGICPDGWHIPSNADWTTLTDYVGSNAGTKLKADSDLWNNNGKGTDDYGFSALPGGYGNSGGSFLDVGYYGHWWSATESNASYAYRRYMGYFSTGVISGSYDKTGLYSVRCVQD